VLHSCRADYSYDQIGQLIEDDAEFISHIEWNTQNKIKRVVRAHPDLIADPSGNVYRSDLEFVYDPLGNRVAKIEKPRDGDGDVKSQLFWIYTLYARDATGNTLATYSRSFETPQGDYPIDHLSVQAHEIYGSKRLGTSRLGLHMQREFEINTMTTASYHAGDQYYLTEDIFDDVTYFTNQVPLPSNQFTHVLGRKQYELSNHLGNVLATISDAKTPKGASGNGQALGYAARVVNLQDYYPFGMLQPGRQFSEEHYNYGFQAQEIDDEYLAGAVSFKYRIHDARIGRFLSVDPLAPIYPWNSTYAFSENRVVDSHELEGLEKFYAADGSYLGAYSTSTELRVVNDIQIWQDIQKNPGTIEYASLQAAFLSSLMKNSAPLYRDEEVEGVIRDWVNKYKPLSKDQEYGMIMFSQTFTEENGDKFTGFIPGTTVTEGERESIMLDKSELLIGGEKIFWRQKNGVMTFTKNPENWTKSFGIHTHPFGGPDRSKFSYEDRHWALTAGISLFLAPYNSTNLYKFDTDVYNNTARDPYVGDRVFMPGPRDFDQNAIQTAEKAEPRYNFSEPIR
jgi:RHS repeat-associated protein